MFERRDQTAKVLLEFEPRDSVIPQIWLVR